jgi:hypothetical protein
VYSTNFLNIKMLGRNTNTKVRKKDIFKPTIENESSYETSNGNPIRVVNFATTNILF